MVKAAEKYGARCAVRNPTTLLRQALPIWYHIGKTDGRCAANSAAAKCLRLNHGVITTAQCQTVASRVTREGSEHLARTSCECAECVEDRTVRSCANPHRCAAAAARLVEKLKDLWRPNRPANADGLTLTRRRIRQNQTARAAHDRIAFNPSVANGTPLATAFRVFVRGGETGTPPALRPPRPYQVQGEEVEVFTDGSCVKNGSADAAAGSGVWFGDGDRRNEGVRVPYDEQSNQVAEMYAVAVAHRKVPPFTPMHVVSD
ncbi:RNase H, partial [Trametes versicolor FP-101664 SS1]|uniref:RNase H n=1 Tax=Trametes versicolor (strain FP-101664) TaxID=717944 RepID=UPI000462163C